MESLTKDQKDVADKLRDELSDKYPIVYPNDGVIEQYVSDGWNQRDTLSVHLLYNHIISQNLCKVEE